MLTCLDLLVFFGVVGYIHILSGYSGSFMYFMSVPFFTLMALSYIPWWLPGSITWCEESIIGKWGNSPTSAQWAPTGTEWCQLPSAQCAVPSTQYWAPSVQCPVPSTEHPVFSTQYPVPSGYHRWLYVTHCMHLPDHSDCRLDTTPLLSAGLA